MQQMRKNFDHMVQLHEENDARWMYYLENNKKKQETNRAHIEGEVDLSYKISNQELYLNTRSKSTSKFYKVQYLTYISYIVRQISNTLQKQAWLRRKCHIKNGLRL